MVHDRPLINDSKTELILIGSKQQLSKLQPISISVGNSTINNSSVVKNLGCQFDANLSMSNHITNVCKSASFYLHSIRSIEKYFHTDSLHTLVHAFITNRLDNCNSLQYGTSKEQIAKEQRVQNAAATADELCKAFAHYSDPILVYVTPARAPAKETNPV